MDSERANIIIGQSLDGIGRGELAGYLAHAYCHAGSCIFTYNRKEFTMATGDCMITRRGDLVSDMRMSGDFRVEVVYVTPEFIQLSVPQSNYGAKGGVRLFEDPIMHLTPEQQSLCVLDIESIKRRLALKGHLFHRDAMINAVQCMIIDFYDFHAQIFQEEEKITSQYALIMDDFIALLERGDFRQNREIGYYADKLCITTKYLSEVSKKVSGFPANYWIVRYTTLDILRQLRDKRKSLKELSDYYGFPSPSYFNRYVQKYIGAAPGELRE